MYPGSFPLIVSRKSLEVRLHRWENVETLERTSVCKLTCKLASMGTVTRMQTREVKG